MKSIQKILAEGEQSPASIDEGRFYDKEVDVFTHDFKAVSKMLLKSPAWNHFKSIKVLSADVHADMRSEPIVEYRVEAVEDKEKERFGIRVVYYWKETSKGLAVTASISDEIYD